MYIYVLYDKENEKKRYKIGTTNNLEKTIAVNKNTCKYGYIEHNSYEHVLFMIENILKKHKIGEEYICSIQDIKNAINKSNEIVCKMSIFKNKSKSRMYL